MGKFLSKRLHQIPSSPEQTLQKGKTMKVQLIRQVLVYTIGVPLLVVAMAYSLHYSPLNSTSHCDEKLCWNRLYGPYLPTR